MKKRGIVLLSSIPCRELSSHRSQQVTQLLFGETYEVITKEGDWYQIITDLDQYPCCIPENQFQELSGNLSYIINKKIDAVIYINNQSVVIPLGALVPNLNSIWKINGLEIENRSISPQEIEWNSENIEYISKQFLRAPYLWGGRTIAGIDCSGFTQLIYRIFDKFIPRDAYQQAEKGEVVSFLTEAKAGDLAFFDNEEGKITHVGLLLNDHQIIHSSGFVRIDTIDHQGIYIASNADYTHKLRLIKSI